MQKYNKLEIGLICLLILILLALILAVQPSKAKEILQPSKYTEMVDIDTMQPLTYTDLKTEMKNLQKAQRLDGKGEPREMLQRVRPMVQGVQVSAPFGRVAVALEVFQNV